MTKKQTPNKGRKFEQVREGAKSIFLRDGYCGASVDDIAAAARVSKATLYSYFPDKALMYREVLHHEIGRLRDISPIDIPDDEPAPQALQRMAQQIAAWLASDDIVRLRRAGIAEANRFGEQSRQLHAVLSDGLREAARRHLDCWIMAGHLTINDSSMAAEHLIRLAGAFVQDRALLTPDDPADEEAIRQAGDAAASMFIASYGICTNKPVSLAAAS